MLLSCQTLDVMHAFYIVFGTNLLTRGPAQIAVFLPISVFRRKGISKGIQTEWNLREHDFLNKRDPEDLEWTSSNQRGGHEAGGAPTPWARPPASWLPRCFLDVHSKSPRLRLFQKRSSRRFRSIWIPFDIPFLRNTEIGKKTTIWVGPPVNRLDRKSVV